MKRENKLYFRAMSNLSVFLHLFLQSHLANHHNYTWWAINEVMGPTSTMIVCARAAPHQPSSWGGILWTLLWEGTKGLCIGMRTRILPLSSHPRGRTSREQWSPHIKWKKRPEMRWDETMWYESRVERRDAFCPKSKLMKSWVPPILSIIVKYWDPLSIWTYSPCMRHASRLTANCIGPNMINPSR